MRNKVVVHGGAVRDQNLRDRLVEALEAMPVVIRSKDGRYPEVRALGRDHSQEFTARVYDLLIEGPFDIKSTDETVCSIRPGEKQPTNPRPHQRRYTTHAHRISYVHRHSNGRRTEYSFGINPDLIDLPSQKTQLR